MILISTSPRRIEILKKYGLLEYNIPHEFDESSIELKKDSDIYTVSLKKIDSVSSKFKKGLLLSCDTVVKLGNTYIGKPINKDDAYRMIELLSGKMHEVISWIVLYDAESREYYDSKAVTKVYFDDLSKDEIQNYIERSDHLDKAGAYAVQDEAALFIKKIEGDYLNVVGFPLNSFYKLLKKF